MGGAWRRAKVALGLNLCVYVPKTLDDDDEGVLSGGGVAGRFSDAVTGESDYRALMPTTPTPTSSGLRLSKSGSRSSKRTCAICLGIMKAGQGHAIFTAECSHTFHFHCIASNVKHGNQVCPVCRAKWKEIPFQISSSSAEPHHGRSRANPLNWSHDDSYFNLLRRLPRVNSNRQNHLTPLFHSSEPNAFDDDEPLDFKSDTARNAQQGSIKTLDIKIYPEFSVIPKSASEDNFAVLVHLKAPHASTRTVPGRGFQSNNLSASQTSRAPVDLVTVLDISGSMAGTKLALLKRAMGFVIQNLGPSDRLSVIAFSSTARRLFHLRRMSESGRQQALQAVNSLVSSGGTNIAEGLRKGAKVLEERKEKKPVCSIILLSDGQDTYTVSSAGSATPGKQPDYRSLVPSSIKDCSGSTHQIPVHAFGFGVDHDSASMHSISETSGGTFSFIEAEGVIQEAFAQCIGGLLSVVVRELRVTVECVHSGVHLSPIKSGSYTSQVTDDGRKGFIDVGNLYADEERDFLVSVNVPIVSLEEVVLLNVACAYRDPVSNEVVNLEGEEVRIQRPECVASRTMSIEVDRERNRVRAIEAMAEARTVAEQGLLSEAVSILEARRRLLSESLAGRSGDRLCLALDAELKEMQERMASRQRYEASGRAYVLSGLSSHSWQRATARGDSTNSASLVHSYQTPSMVDMVNRSQILCPSAWRSTPPIRPTKSFLAPPEPR
ncbi:uncharacterized protein M6B38_361520 [Iris pallida]|uniref:Uncharacterized protein n=1 Tax=Iris pallida TaxID=29817 RepID=A0AAX6GJW5_IRIPA|nr:uncharacterized protein M6B38_361520 [Iris pallida]